MAQQTWEPLVTKGWNLLQEHTGIRKIAQQTFTFSPTPILLKQEGSSAILHVIGNPISTASGLRLRISAPYNYVPSTCIEETVCGEEANILVRSEDLPLATAILVIVQAEPVELERRLDTDREQAYDLRSFAADVFAAGARTVIALPAVSPDLAQAVLNELAIALHDQPVPDRSHILFAVTRIRRLVATWSVAGNQTGDGIQTVDTETLRELALDICVFAR